MPFTPVDRAQIYWKLEGPEAAPALILLNSIGTDMDLWDATLPHLRERFRLLRIDTRGHGASSAEADDFSLEQLARDVLKVAEAAGFTSFRIAGVSLGGMIAMQLALLAPATVQRLALICTSATMDPAAWRDRVVKVREHGMASIADLSMGRFLSDATRDARPGLYDTLRRQLLLMNQDGYAGCAAAIRDMELAAHLKALACPALVVTGTRDVSTPFEGHGDYLLANIPVATHVALDTAHLAPIEAPAELATALIELLAT